MGFRNAEEARAHRIRALETELEERDREIATLRAKLEGGGAPKTQSKEQAASAPDEDAAPSPERIPVDPDVPEGDRWTISLDEPVGGARFLAGFIFCMVAISSCLHVVGCSWRTAITVVLVSSPVLLLFLCRRELVLDKRAGTITKGSRLLFVRWAGAVLPYRGQSIRIEIRSYSPTSGEAFGFAAFLGKEWLFGGQKAYVHRLVRRIAAFLQIRYQDSQK